MDFDLSLRIAALLADPSPEAAEQLRRFQGVIDERSLAADFRIIQAKRWFDVASLHLGVRTLAQYLATVAPMPEAFLTPRGALNLPTLTEGRLGNVIAAKVAGLQHGEYGYTDKTLIPIDDVRYAFPREPMWVLAHDGGPNLGLKPTNCLAQCTGELYGGIDRVGIAIHLIHGPRKHAMDLPGSVRADGRGYCAYVYPFGGRPDLGAVRHAGVATPHYGTVVFVRE